MRLFQNWRHRPCSLWPAQWYSRLHSIKEQMLLIHDCGTNGVHVKPSSIQQVDAQFSCFSAHCFPEGEMIEFNSEILMYTNVVALIDRSEAYGEGSTAIAAPYFKKYTIQLDINVGSSHRYAQNVWFVPTKFSCWQFRNDQCYLADKKPLC